jgi:hypothetical protein
MSSSSLATLHRPLADGKDAESFFRRFMKNKCLRLRRRPPLTKPAGMAERPQPVMQQQQQIQPKDDGKKE